MQGIGDALAVAHEAGIVHRDLKPENILLTKSGHAKLADFGVAKLFERDQGVTGAQEQTQTGMIVGTAGYMSPEQVSGRAVDARSDIFSFGVVLHELLMGRRPFAASSTIEELHRILNAAPAPLTSDVPEGLRSIVEKTLQKAAGDRYQSMRDLTTDLRRLQGTPSAPAVSMLRRSSNRLMPAAIVLVILLTAIAAWAVRSQFRRPAGATPPLIRSIAVLPLLNLSNVPEQEFFSDGTTDALISSLAQIHALQVTSRTSIMRYKRVEKSIPEIGRELGVDAVIEGSVQRAGNRIRITAALIRATTNTHLWSHDYDGDASDLFRLQSDVARAVAREVGVALTPEEGNRLEHVRPVNALAQDAYLLGRHRLFRQSVTDIQEAIQQFERATRLDPNYAQAWAALSVAVASLHNFIPQPIARIRDPAEQAVALDPDLADGFVALGVARFNEWRWVEAEQAFSHATALSPDSVAACGCYALFLAAMERFPEATAQVDRGVKVNPVASESHFNRAFVMFYARRFDEAMTEAHRALELERSNMYARLFLAMAQIEVGRTEDGIKTLDVPEFRGGAYQAYAYARANRRAQALALVTKLRSVTTTAEPLAIVYIALNDPTRAVDAVSRAIERHEGPVKWLRVNPLYDPIRGDVRFQTAVAQLKLPLASPVR